MVIYPPSPIPVVSNLVFLAGSIEQNKAENWQDYLIQKLDNNNITILNPRRKEWDNTWKETIDNPVFSEQVNWELQAQENAAIIAMYFDPKSKSPISLLELGLFARSGKMVVCCPEGFWKKGNVDVVCARYHVPQVRHIDELIEFIKNM